MTSRDEAVSSAAQRFNAEFDHEPAGVWSAPGRVNLIGEYTDLADGYVLPCAIEQRAYVAVSPRADTCVRLTSSGYPAAEVALDSLAPGHPAGWAGYLAGALWVLRRAGHEVGGCDASLASQVPTGSGLSSSAAIASAILLALNDIYGLALDTATLARLGRVSENEFVGMPCGALDHSASLRCTAGHALFLDTGTGSADQIPLDLDAHGLALLIIDTRAPHRLVDGAYAERRERILRAQRAWGRHLDDRGDHDDLDVDARRAAAHIVSENARVLAARAALVEGRPHDLGPLLSASHRSLRDDLEVSSIELDAAVDAAVAAGALGARMTGAGFGGSVIALVDTGRVSATAARVRGEFASRGWTTPNVARTAAAAGAGRDR